MAKKSMPKPPRLQKLSADSKIKAPKPAAGGKIGAKKGMAYGC